jgi:capsular exopolysaccharide synthesis family protein
LAIRTVVISTSGGALSATGLGTGVGTGITATGPAANVGTLTLTGTEQTLSTYLATAGKLVFSGTAGSYTLTVKARALDGAQVLAPPEVEEPPPKGKTIQDISLAMQREESDRVEIVQRALKPREITFPKFKVMIPVTAVLVAGFYVLILFVREFLDQRVKYPSDLMSVPGKILGTVPERSDDPTDPKRAEMVVREASQSVLAENYRQLSAQVMKGMLVTGAKSLLVLSAMPEAGTTTVALNLAACEAAVGRRVLIIGANMRRPGLSRALGINLGLPGLGEILSGADPASVVSTVSPNIDLISAGAPEHRVFERLSGERLDAVLRWANDHYDFVIVDGPPSVVASEALTIANKVDASMIVTRAWKDQRGLVMKLAGQLLESRSQFLGVMLNRMRMTAGGYLRKNAEAMAEYAEHTTAFGGTDTVAEQTKRKAKPKAT